MLKLGTKQEKYKIGDKVDYCVSVDNCTHDMPYRHGYIKGVVTSEDGTVYYCYVPKRGVVDAVPEQQIFGLLTN